MKNLDTVYGNTPTFPEMALVVVEVGKTDRIICLNSVVLPEISILRVHTIWL